MAISCNRKINITASSIKQNLMLWSMLLLCRQLPSSLELLRNGVIPKKCLPKRSIGLLLRPALVLLPVLLIRVFPVIWCRRVRQRESCHDTTMFQSTPSHRWNSRRESSDLRLKVDKLKRDYFLFIKLNQFTLSPRGYSDFCRKIKFS